MTKFLLSLTVSLLAAAALSGCAAGLPDNSRWTSTPVDSGPQREYRYSQIADIQHRMMNEDIDKILLMDRSSRLMYWHAQYGH